MQNSATSLTAVDLYPGPDLYYYEVIECGRRMLLTGVLIFIAPQSATQAAMACIFAFGSLLGFELLRPHMDPSGSWLYRLVSLDAFFVCDKAGLTNCGASALPKYLSPPL